LQMEKDDKGSTLIRIGVSGESSFWYRPTRVVPDQRPLNGRRVSVVDHLLTYDFLLAFHSNYVPILCPWPSVL